MHDPIIYIAAWLMMSDRCYNNLGCIWEGLPGRLHIEAMTPRGVRLAQAYSTSLEARERWRLERAPNHSSENSKAWQPSLGKPVLSSCSE